MASSQKRSSCSCSFLTLLLLFFNFILFLLSAASLAPTLALRTPPASLGWAFLAISAASLLSSLVGFCSHLCFSTYVCLLLASSAAQLLGILALFAKEQSSLELLRSPRDPREAKVLVRVECGALIAMFVMQLGVLALSCVAQCCWVRDYEGKEANKKRQKIARVVQEEAVVGTAAETNKRKIDEKMIDKYGKWNKNDFNMTDQN